MYGQETWEEIAEQADLGFTGFEALLIYDDEITHRVLAAAADKLNNSVEAILEDIGTYLVSHPTCEAPRRLLRFGGACFDEFLYSLDELQGRAKLAVSELDLPTLELKESGPGNFTLFCADCMVGFGHVFVGILRAMADDYGALVILEHQGQKLDVQSISIQVLETSFSEGRSFDLALGVG